MDLGHRGCMSTSGHREPRTGSGKMLEARRPKFSVGNTMKQNGAKRRLWRTGDPADRRCRQTHEADGINGRGLVRQDLD
ncbi:hypothetical protein CLV78_101546 [Aliiruegeria haliotis]|uniref:Uncharacterized protein n=1 Tax=Aliiruegeria haliotis TaxID=1280846 RepID=A0A2T0RZ46_9RHOB|nr:hypothetical protein CLV78_101546 [Aliiruegeria haliotis]